MSAIDQDVDLESLLHDPTEDDPTHVVHEPCPGQPGVERIALCGEVMHADHRRDASTDQMCQGCEDAIRRPGKCPTCDHTWPAL